jgi:hypothetical protein
MSSFRRREARANHSVNEGERDSEKNSVKINRNSKDEGNAA